MSHEESQEKATDITLLVLERGAEWPSWGTGIRMRAANSAVEVQADGESTAAFQERVERRLAKVAEIGMNLRAAGYACALDSVGRRNSRREICSQLLAALDESEGSELVLAGGSWETSGEEGAERSNLIQLWSELSHQRPGRMMSIRFEDPPTDSGVFRAAEKLTNTQPLHRPISRAAALGEGSSSSLMRR